MWFDSDVSDSFIYFFREKVGISGFNFLNKSMASCSAFILAIVARFRLPGGLPGPLPAILRRAFDFVVVLVDLDDPLVSCGRGLDTLFRVDMSGEADTFSVEAVAGSDAGVGILAVVAMVVLADSALSVLRSVVPISLPVCSSPCVWAVDMWHAGR